MPFSPRLSDGAGGLAPAFPLAPVASQVFIVLALLLGVAGSVEAGRIYDPASMPKASYVAPLAAYPEASYRAKDFSVIKKGDWYHLFYTRVQRFVPHHWSDGTRTVLNETCFGHAISADLETWIELDTVMTASQVPGAWDAHHVWAPSLYEHDGVTWMVFTGVRDLQQSTNPADWIPRWQVIGAAYSTDPMLQTWVRVFDPVFQPCAGPTGGGVPWALCTPLYAGYSADFRDPFVLPPVAGSSDPWLLFYTARVRWDTPNYVAGVATAPGPGGPWTNLDALWDTYYPPINSKIESPHVFRRGSDLHLLFSGDDGSTGIAWHTSHGSPAGPWTARPRLIEFLTDSPDVPYPFDLEPEAWFASEQWSETTPAGSVDYLAVVHSYDAPPEYNPAAPAAGEDISAIEFRRIVWDDAGGTFRLVAPNLARALRSSATDLEVGESLALEIDSESGSGELVELAVAIVNGDRVTPIDPATIGLPGMAALTGTKTTVPWTVDNTGVPLPATLRISIANQPLRPATTVNLRAYGASDELPGTDDPIVRGIPQREPTVVAQRADGGGSAGIAGAPAVLALDLPASGRARIALYDVTGRLVRTLVDEPLPAGASTWRWDGLDAQGRPAPRGLYFARLTTDHGAATARVALGR